MPYLAVADVEAAVERQYQFVQLPDDMADRIRQGLRRELNGRRLQAAPAIARARKRVAELEQERRRLASAVVTGAIPEDLAREEQKRTYPSWRTPSASWLPPRWPMRRWRAP